MGYVVTTLPTRYAKKANIESLQMLYFGLYQAGAAYSELYKQDLDVTNVDYLALVFYLGGTRDLYFKVSQNGTTVDETKYAKSTYHHAKIDLSGVTGVKTIKLEAKGDGGTMIIEYFSMFTQES